MGDIFGHDTSAGQEAAQNAMFPSNFYSASGNFAAKTVSVAADRYRLLTPADGAIKIAGSMYYWPTQQTLDLSLTATWDTIAGTDYRTAGNRAGVDFYIYACQPGAGVTTPIWKVSANASAPSGYTTANSVLVGGFHGECVAIDHNTTLTAWAADTVIALGCTRKSTVWNGKIIRCTARAGDFKTHATDEPAVAAAAVGATLVDDQITWIVEQHALEGYVAGDILPASVWDLKNRPACGPIDSMAKLRDGMWVDIYLPSGTGSSTRSANGGVISDNRVLQNFFLDFWTVNKQPISWTDFVLAAQGGPNGSSMATVPNTTGGAHVDSYGRSCVSNLGFWDMTGVQYQMTSTRVIVEGSQVSMAGGNAQDGNSGPWYETRVLLTASNAAYTSRGCCPAKINV